MEKILITFSVLSCLLLAECSGCVPANCNKLCNTTLNKMDLEACECVCYTQVDDIIMRVSMWEAIQAESTERAASSNLARWDDVTSDGFVRIPFYMTADLEASETHKNAIIAGLGVLNAVTCLRFDIVRPGDVNIIEFYNGTGCSSFVGRRGGTQQISLTDGCTRLGTVQHEAMHALGFWHEHSRPDRDNHVTILAGNIEPGRAHNFYKILASDVDSFSSPYDFPSVMQYSPYAFSIGSDPTIVLSSDNTSVFDTQRTAVSLEDQSQINAMYECGVKRGIPETSDCYHPLDRGFSYRGTNSTTRGGKTCQAWNVQVPHSHILKPDLVTGAGLNSNYCRNPDAKPGGPWCYTTTANDPRWDYCGIPICENPVPEIGTEGTWNDWGEFSTCNKRCGNGKKMRVRTCSTAMCPTGKPFNKANCKNKNCVFAVWTKYAKWSSCHCTEGKRYRVRKCLGGHINEGLCRGRAWRIGRCTCSEDDEGIWGRWGFRSECNATCGQGAQMQVRTCSTGNCPTGKPFRTRNCQNTNCPNGLWTPYGAWSGCDCSQGKRYRVRQCVGGVINEGGCIGSAWESQACTCSAPPSGGK